MCTENAGLRGGESSAPHAHSQQGDTRAAAGVGEQREAAAAVPLAHPAEILCLLQLFPAAQCPPARAQLLLLRSKASLRGCFPSWSPCQRVAAHLSHSRGVSIAFPQLNYFLPPYLGWQEQTLQLRLR